MASHRWHLGHVCRSHERRGARRWLHAMRWQRRAGRVGGILPPTWVAFLPLVVVILVNLAMSLFVLPALDTSFLAEERFGATSLSAVGGVWAVVVALAAAIAVVVALNYRRLRSLRDTMDAGANASVLPALSVASLVGFGAVVAALPAFAVVRDWVLSIGGGPLVSLAVATNILSALTGSASGGLSIALDALGETYLRLAIRARNRPGSPSPSCRDERRHARQPAPQRRGGDPTCRLRRIPPRCLHGSVCGRDRRSIGRTCGRHHSRINIGFVLTALVVAT